MNAPRPVSDPVCCCSSDVNAPIPACKEGLSRASELWEATCQARVKQKKPPLNFAFYGVQVRMIGLHTSALGWHGTAEAGWSWRMVGHDLSLRGWHLPLARPPASELAALTT